VSYELVRLREWSKLSDMELYEACFDAAALIAVQSSTIARLEHALLIERGKVERADEVAQQLIQERDVLREALKRVRPRTGGIDRQTVDAALAPAEQPKEGTP
jgi:hypothetical protein